MVPDLLVLLWDTPLPPRLQGLFDQAPNELRQGGGGIILEIEPMRMSPVVGGRQLHRWVLVDPVVLEVDAGTSHRRMQLLPGALLPLLLEGDDEEVPPQIKVGTDP